MCSPDSFMYIFSYITLTNFPICILSEHRCQPCSAKALIQYWLLVFFFFLFFYNTSTAARRSQLHRLWQDWHCIWHAIRVDVMGLNVRAIGCMCAWPCPMCAVAWVLIWEVCDTTGLMEGISVGGVSDARL